MKKRIVAEVTRNWKGKDADLKEPILSQRFEKIIAVNAERGFVLESWQFNVTQGEWITETIIAVFVEARPMMDETDIQELKDRLSEI